MLVDPSGCAAKNNLFVYMLLLMDYQFYAMFSMFGISFDYVLNFAVRFMDDETLQVAATVAGEASRAECPGLERRAIANVINNRYYDTSARFSSQDSLFAVISSGEFYGYMSGEYKRAMDFYRNGGFDYKGAFTSCMRQTAYVLYGIVGDNSLNAVFFNHTNSGSDANPDSAKLIRITGLPTSWYHNNFYKWK